MTVPYKAYMESRVGKTVWNGSISPVDIYDGTIDIWVTARGSRFHCIIGTYSGGRYICIPELNIGTSLADLNDSYWNSEHLELAGLCPVDAASLGCALAALNQNLCL